VNHSLSEVAIFLHHSSSTLSREWDTYPVNSKTRLTYTITEKLDNIQGRVRRVYQRNGFGVRGQSAVCLRLGRQLSSAPAQGVVGKVMLTLILSRSGSSTQQR